MALIFIPLCLKPVCHSTFPYFDVVEIIGNAVRSLMSFKPIEKCGLQSFCIMGGWKKQLDLEIPETLCE